MHRLLVVEDDPLQRRLMGYLLARHFEVTVCDQFQAQEYDWCDFSAVLLDIMMAVHDGPSLVRKAAGLCVTMPTVVFYSAMPRELLEREVGALSGVAPVYYISKAGSPDALIETLLALCES